jgi:hypothetical protein
VPQPIQRSFTSGEIAPSLQSRADLVKYATGLNLCQDFIIRAQGGAYSRPGFRFIGELDDSLKVGRLIPFSFNTEQTYSLVFEDLKMRVIKDGGYVLKPAATITNVTKANPAVVTANNTFVDAEQVTITGVVGMTELNGNTYTIDNVTPTTFELQGVNSTGYTAYSSGGSAQSDGIYELITTYTEAELSRLGYTQSADVMTIAHPDHDPANLSRLADDNWTLAAVNYASTVSAPTFSGATVRTITDITQAPTAVVTAVGHGFSTGNTVEINSVVGMTEVNGNTYRITVLTNDTFELDGINSTGYGSYTSGGTATRQNNANTFGTGFGTYDKTYSYIVTAVDASGVESLASSTASLTTSSLSQTGGIRLQWNAVSGAEYYRVYKDPSNNTGIFGWIGDSNNTTFDDYNIAPITSDAPPLDRQPFSGSDNKPATVNYYQQRQVFSNTNNEPQTTYTTQVNNFNSLRVSNPTRDDDAVTFTIAAQQVNEIRHIISLNSMVLLTSGGEWLVSEGQDQVLTPATIGVRIQSYNGSSWVKPVIINSTAIYLQEKGARLRDLAYEFSSDKYTGNDLSIMSEHLFDDHQIIEMAYSDEPYGILWCIRDDGILLGLTYLREHQVWGWHRHVTDGEFESVITISEDNRDAVYVIVKRIIDGQVKRYVERFEHREEINVEDCFYVDSGLTLDIPSDIENITQANPAVVTITDHPFTDGMSVKLRDVVGMTELNNQSFIVSGATANTFELNEEDSTSYNAYSSGGTVRQEVTNITGLDHLEGKGVVALTDGYVTENLTVSSGAITLPRAASIIHVGLQYIPAIETLDIDSNSPVDSIKTHSVSVSKVFIEVEKSRGGFIGPRQDATAITPIPFQEIKPRFDSDNYDAIDLKTYKMEISIDPQWSKGGGVRIEQRAPLPLSILSVTPRVDIGGS